MNTEMSQRAAFDYEALINLLDTGDKHDIRAMRRAIRDYVQAREWLEANLHLPVSQRGLMPLYAYKLYRLHRKFWDCEARLRVVRDCRSPERMERPAFLQS